MPKPRTNLFLGLILCFALSEPTAAQFGLNGSHGTTGCAPRGTENSAILGSEIGSCMVAGMTSIYLVNRGDIDIKFTVRPESGTWRNLELKAGSGDAIFSSSGSATFFDIILRTGPQEINYKLPSGERFAIYWNAEKQVWDVVRITG